MTLERQTEDYLLRFEAAVRKFPEIRECLLVTGVTDYWLRVTAKSLGLLGVKTLLLCSHLAIVLRSHVLQGRRVPALSLFGYLHLARLAPLFVGIASLFQRRCDCLHRHDGVRLAGVSSGSMGTLLGRADDLPMR